MDQTSSPHSETEEEACEFVTTDTAFKSRLVTYELKRKFLKQFTLQLFLTFVFDHVICLLKKVQSSYNCVKINLFLECEFMNTKGETCLKNFKTNNTALFKTTDLEDFCSDLFYKLVKEKEDCDFKGSGWSFVKVKRFEIRANKYNPLRRAAYIPSPENLKASLTFLILTIFALSIVFWLNLYRGMLDFLPATHLSWRENTVGNH